MLNPCFYAEERDVAIDILGLLKNYDNRALLIG
jgi:hypothetical protein